MTAHPEGPREGPREGPPEAIPGGYLQRRNPTAKFGAALVLSLGLVLVIDPVTPLLFLALTVLSGVVLGRLTAAAYARALAPLLLVALGFVLTNALFAAVPADASGVLWRWGPLRLTQAGLLFGLGIGLRGLAIGALSVTVVLTTDPTDLVVCLIRHARLPFRIGYALLAGYRFLPFFAQEVEQIRLAQRVRGLGGRAAAGSPLTRLRAPVATLLILGSSALRRAARVAVAMDARGFAAARHRTYLREVPLRWSDALFLAGAAGAAAGLLALGAAGGWLRLWDGRFSV